MVFETLQPCIRPIRYFTVSQVRELSMQKILFIPVTFQVFIHICHEVIYNLTDLPNIECKNASPSSRRTGFVTPRARIQTNKCPRKREHLRQIT